MWKSLWRERGVDILPTGDGGWTRYTFAEAMRIAVVAQIAQLRDASRYFESAARAAKNIQGYKDDLAFLLLIGGPVKAGGLRLRDGSAPSINISGALTSKVVRGRQLSDALHKAGPNPVIVLNLNAIEDCVKAGWPSK